MISRSHPQSSLILRTCFAFALTLLLPIAAKAEALDLDTALREAMANNPSLQQARERLNQARYDKAVVRAKLFPEIVASGGPTYKKDAVADRPAAAVLFGGDPYNNYLADIRLTQPIFAYGSLAAVRRAEYDREISNTDLEQKERTIKADVIQAYYRIVLNRALLDLQLKNQTLIEESLGTSQSRYRTGRGQLIDTLQVRTQLALVKPKIQQAQNNLDVAVSELTNLMGATKRTSFELKGEIPSLLIKDVEAKLDLRSFYLPELQNILFRYESLQETRSITFGKHLPSINLIGDYQYSNFTKSELFTGQANSWFVQVALTVPIFSGFSSIYERRSLNSQEAQLELQKRDTGNNLILAQIKARKGLETAEASLASAQEAADLASQTINEANRDYRLATIDFLQVLQVQQSYVESISSLNQLKYDAVAAYVNYFTASGQPLDTLVDFLMERNKNR
jgi:outer membrane protein